MSAGSEIRAGSPIKLNCAPSVPPRIGRISGVTPQLWQAFLCQRYQPWAGIDDLFHIAVLLGDGKSYGTFPPFFIEDLRDMGECF